MRIWRIWDPADEHFASFDGEAKWKQIEEREGLCPECTSPPKSVRLPGLTIAWQPGANVVGDFSWSIGGGWILLKQHVLEGLAAEFSGFDGIPVTMVQNPKLKPPTRPNRRTPPRVWLPYTGEPLCELWVTTYIHMDPKRSTAELVRQCQICGYTQYELHGVERTISRWDRTHMDLVFTHLDRKAGQGLYVQAADLRNAAVFRVHEISGWTFCLDVVKQFIEQRGYTNIAFEEYGDTI